MGSRRDAARVRVFPPAVPLVAIISGIVLERMIPISSQFPVPIPARYVVGNGIVILSALLLGAWAVLLFRTGGQTENPWKPTTRIERRGPYRWTRNPMYLQMVLICVGLSIALANWWILLLTPLVAWLLLVLAIKPEEEYLQAKFGEEYLRYKREVRRWF